MVRLMLNGGTINDHKASKRRMGHSINTAQSDRTMTKLMGSVGGSNRGNANYVAENLPEDSFAAQGQSTTRICW